MIKKTKRELLNSPTVRRDWDKFLKERIESDYSERDFCMWVQGRNFSIRMCEIDLTSISVAIKCINNYIISNKKKKCRDTKCGG